MYTVYNTRSGVVIAINVGESKLVDIGDINNEVILTSNLARIPIVGITKIVNGVVVNSDWGNIREQRELELDNSDWRDLPSYPGIDQTAWRVYRQELREIPQDHTNVEDIIWPVKP